MNRAKELPEWVVGNVLAICRGYDMRASYAAKHKKISAPVYKTYKRYNSAIDNAIEAVCEGANEAAAIRLALVEGITWERITACACGRRRFYELRKSAIERIARELCILEE